MITIELTDSEVNNLMEFIEIQLIPTIRIDDYIDNIEWVKDMCSVHQKLKEGAEE